MHWIDLAQKMEEWRAVVSTVMNLCVPLNAGYFLPMLSTASVSKMALLYGISYQEQQWSDVIYYEMLISLIDLDTFSVLIQRGLDLKRVSHTHPTFTFGT